MSGEYTASEIDTAIHIYYLYRLCKDYGITDGILWDDKTKDRLLLTGTSGGASLIRKFRNKI